MINNPYDLLSSPYSFLSPIQKILFSLTMTIILLGLLHLIERWGK